MSRSAQIKRDTAETRVLVELELDGAGVTDIATGVGFYDHMLSQLGRHAGFDLTVRTDGDVHIDAHHTVEDTAIALGQALATALGDKAGIRRFGDSLVPLDECLVQVAVDLSGRPYLVHDEPAVMDTAVIGGDFPGPWSGTCGSPSPRTRGSHCTCGCCPAATPTTSPRRSARPSPGRCATPRHPIRRSSASPAPRGRCRWALC